MPAIKLLETRRQKAFQYLREQLAVEVALQRDVCEDAELYLSGKGIFDVTLIEETDFRAYKQYLKRGGQYTQRQVVDGVAALRKIQDYWIKREYRELLGEIDRCIEAEKEHFTNIKRFLIRQRIHHVREINYAIRNQYEQELLGAKDRQYALRILKNFDRIKQHDIRLEMEAFSSQRRKLVKYENQIIFLPYLPNQKLAVEFDKIQDKREWVWDFKQDAPEQLKRQVFMLLFYILENVEIENPKERRVRFLLPLQWLYEFCIEENVEDIEQLELCQIQRFEQIAKENVVNYKNSTQIVDNCRKILFLNATKIHWHANVWYMERFHLAPERTNPSNPVQRISFLEVTNSRNRKLLQKYGKYLVGITGLTIHNIRTQLRNIENFLSYFSEDDLVGQIGEPQIDTYFKTLQDDKTQANTVNKKIVDITKFYQYLKIQKVITELPFHPEYYLQKTYPVHHDRSVEEETCMEVLSKLHSFPDVPRLIFLHLWGTGLRISEVCTLKGNAYYWDGKDAWLKVYQIKMKADKMIPIPLVLYTVMQWYIQKKHIRSKEYLFKSQNGGAYRVGSFIKTFKYHCKKNMIANDEYLFKSHDFRHTLATRFYDDGVTLQTIRDYLGHVTDEMTKQYIDYMPNKVAKANQEYFQENDLAAGLEIKRRGEEHEK